MDIADAIQELRRRNEAVPLPRRLPTEQEVTDAEAGFGAAFPPDYRRYLLEASDVVFGLFERCVVIPDDPRPELVVAAREAWDAGVPRNLLPICEDNGDYLRQRRLPATTATACLDGRTVRFWSHDGVTDESWPELATWIADVWIGDSA